MNDLGGISQQLAPFDLHLEHQGLHITGEHDVAAPAQHELGVSCPLGIGQQLNYIGIAGDMHQCMGFGNNMKAIKSLKGDVFLD